MRKTIYKLISEAVNGLVDKDRILATGFADSPPGKRVFIAVRFTEDVAEFDLSSKMRFEVWVYDRQPTYDRIQSIIDRLKLYLTDVEHPSEGISQIIYEGESPDLYDDVYNACMRRVSFMLPRSLVRI